MVIFSDSALIKKERLESIRSLGSRRPDTDPAVTWRDLSSISEEFYWDSSLETLTLLLDRWTEYWQWAWGNNPPSYSFLIELWQEVMEQVQFKLETAPDQILHFPETLAVIREIASKDPRAVEGMAEIPQFRFGNPREAIELRQAIRAGLFADGYARIVNSELSHYGLENSIISMRATPSGMVRQGAEMMLINRLNIAFEQYARKIIISTEWTGRDMQPPPYVVLINRVQRALQLYRLFEPETRPGWGQNENAVTS